MMRTRLVLALACLSATLVPVVGSAAVADPVVTGPITGGLRGFPLWDSWFDLSEHGYAEAEYFVSGSARNNGPTEELASYTTRIIVTRPAAAEDFNGTVVIEWVNVTAQFENAVDIISAHEYLLREGYAYVHASVQSAGICCSPLTPKVWDPVRYEPLSHPGDAYTFDMFSQIAKAVRAPAGVDPMDGLSVERVLAAGQSQSASRLYAYVTQAQQDAGVIDGFLIHGGGSKEYAQAPAVPVLHLLSDAEASPAEPNQTTNYRLWEVAGSSHSDFWIGYHQVVGQGPRFAGLPKMDAGADEELHATAGNYGERFHPLDLTCVLAGSTFPMRYSVSAAIEHLDAWVAGGPMPPAAPRYTFEGSSLARDEHGNARGGIRLPPVEVPVATYVSTVCALGGITIPFSEVQLAELYPTHADYYCEMVAETAESVAGGFLLEPDAADLLARAAAATDRWLDPGTPDC